MGLPKHKTNSNEILWQHILATWTSRRCIHIHNFGKISSLFKIAFMWDASSKGLCFRVHCSLARPTSRSLPWYINTSRYCWCCSGNLTNHCPGDPTWLFCGPVHATRRKWKRSFISTVTSTVHTNPARKWSYENALQTGGIWKLRRLCVLEWREKPFRKPCHYGSRVVMFPVRQFSSDKKSVIEWKRSFQISLA